MPGIAPVLLARVLSDLLRRRNNELDYTSTTGDPAEHSLKSGGDSLAVVTCGPSRRAFGERRLPGSFQNRYGPNRVGWGGSLQLVADMIKMFLQRRLILKFPGSRHLYRAPMIALYFAAASPPLRRLFTAVADLKHRGSLILPDDGRSGGLRGTVRRVVVSNK